MSYRSGIDDQNPHEGDREVPVRNSELTTMKDEFTEKSKGAGLIVGGAVLIALSIASNFFDTPPAAKVLLLLIGVIMMFAGAKIAEKAQHVAWVSEAIRKEAKRGFRQLSDASGNVTTITDEYGEKGKGTLYMIMGFLMFAGGIAGAAASQSPSLLFFSFLGFCSMIIGSRILKKAKFIAWTREALRKNSQLLKQA